MITVGFDLDLTLADTRRGISITYAALAAETGVTIDTALVVSRLGPPLEWELAHWFPADQVTAMADRYRELTPRYAVPCATPMPGAQAAVDAVHSQGGRSIVVTAKNQRDSEAIVERLGLAVDAVVGSLWAEAKGEALRAHGVAVYVGDHLGDIRAARAAGALSVAVATGPYDAPALHAYGADVVLPDLIAFPDWLNARPVA